MRNRSLFGFAELTTIGSYIIAPFKWVSSTTVSIFESRPALYPDSLYLTFELVNLKVEVESQELRLFRLGVFSFSSVSLIENFRSNIVYSYVELFAYGLTMILEVLGLNGRSEWLAGSLFYSYEIKHYIALIISLGTT